MLISGIAIPVEPPTELGTAKAEPDSKSPRLLSVVVLFQTITELAEVAVPFVSAVEAVKKKLILVPS